MTCFYYITFAWHMTIHNQVNIYQSFRGTYTLKNRGSKFLLNVRKFATNYGVSHSKSTNLWIHYCVATFLSSKFPVPLFLSTWWITFLFVVTALEQSSCCHVS